MLPLYHLRSADRNRVKLEGTGARIEMWVGSQDVHVTGDIPALAGLVGTQADPGPGVSEAFALRGRAGLPERLTGELRAEVTMTAPADRAVWGGGTRRPGRRLRAESDRRARQG
jgi:hypothetical protein